MTKHPFDDAMSAVLSRRRFLTQAGISAAAIAGMAAIARPAQARGVSHDVAIVQAAATAEALATTMYYNIIASAIYQDPLIAGNDQAYLVAGYEEELDHYNLLSSVAPALSLDFYFPTGMFGDSSTYATTVNTLITLEDAFIAAYLIGIRDLSPGYQVLAGQIMGVECEHRALGRVLAADLNLHSTTGYSGVAEGVDSPSNTANNLAYQRTFGAPFVSPSGLPTLNQISDVEAALTPFISPGTAGFTAAPYGFAASSKGLPSGVASVMLADSTP
jgi:hypothetical protein